MNCEKISKKKENCFSKICSAVLATVIIALICIDIFCESKVISYATLVLVFALIIVTFSGSFTSFSIGNLFSMSRTINETKTTVENSAEETRRNFMQLFANINNINQTMSKASVLHVENLFLGDDSKDAKKEYDSQELKDITAKISRKDLETFAIKKYSAQMKIDPNIITTDAVIKSNEISDVVNDNKDCYFDAFVELNGITYFIIIKPSIKYTSYLYYRIYYMLNRIHLYNIEKQKQSRLLFLFVSKLPDEQGDFVFDTIGRIESDFNAAKNIVLLQVEHYEYEK